MLHDHSWCSYCSSHGQQNSVVIFDTFIKRSCKMHLLTLPCMPAYLSIGLSVQSHDINSETNMCSLLKVIHMSKFCLQQSNNKCQTLYIKTQQHFCSNLKHNVLNIHLRQKCSHKSCRENWNTFYAHICTSAWPVIMVSLIQKRNWYSTSKHMNWKIMETKASHDVCVLRFMRTTHRAQAHKCFKSIKFSCVRCAWKYTELTDKPYDLTISTYTLSIWQPFHPP